MAVRSGLQPHKEIKMTRDAPWSGSSWLFAMAVSVARAIMPVDQRRTRCRFPGNDGSDLPTAGATRKRRGVPGLGCLPQTRKGQGWLVIQYRNDLADAGHHRRTRNSARRPERRAKPSFRRCGRTLSSEHASILKVDPAQLGRPEIIAYDNRMPGHLSARSTTGWRSWAAGSSSTWTTARSS